MATTAVPVTLIDPDGSPLAVGLLAAGTRAGLPSATFELTLDAWEHAEAHGLLHADPSRRRGAARPFDRAKAIHVEAVLDPVAAVDGSDALADRLLMADVGEPLLSTEAWWVLSATQEVDLPPDLAGTGSLSEGVSFAHPSWLRDAGSVGLDEAWQRALEIAEGSFDDDDAPLLELVYGMFEEHGWQLSRPNEEATIVHAVVESDAGQFDLYVRTDEEARLVTAFAVLPIDVPEDRVADAVEFACRRNGIVPVGSFEADADTGLVSFKNGLDVSADRLSPALLRSLVGTALQQAERAIPLLEDVLAGRRVASEAAVA